MMLTAVSSCSSTCNSMGSFCSVLLLPLIQPKVGSVYLEKAREWGGIGEKFQMEDWRVHDILCFFFFLKKRF